MRSTLRAALAAAALLCLPAVSSLAGSSSAFQIEIVLQAGRGAALQVGLPGQPGREPRVICTTALAEEGLGSLVQVLCTIGAFVTIAPMAGQGLATSIGETYRYDVGPGSPLTGMLVGASGRNPGQIVGTVTTLHLSNATRHSSALEMLVSF